MPMLDLNVDVISTDSANAEKEETMEVEHSGTSKSSVVNSDEAANLIADENSLNKSSSTFIFDILKKETHEDATKENLESEIMTRSFFPASGDKRGRDSDFKSGFSASSRPQWPNLEFSEAAAGQAESKILQQKEPQVRKSRRGPRSRSSQYRGVTFYRRTGRWESHIWDCGKQVYLGGFDTAHSAARAYDRAAIKFRGINADINFSLSDYEEDLKQMRDLSKEEFVHILRRRGTGIPRGSSKHKNIALREFGQLEPRVGQFLGKKIYEKPVIKCDGRDGSTSFEPINYQRGIILDSSRGGGCHNLDLKLGISPPSKELKGNNDGAAQFSFRCAVCEIPNKGEPTADSSAYPLIKGHAIYGLTMQPMSDQIYPAFYPSYSQNLEERGREKRLEAIPLPRISNLAWRLHSNGSVAGAPVFSGAASSGFASSSNNASSSAPLPINPLNKSFYNYCSTTASTVNSSCLRNRSS